MPVVMAKVQVLGSRLSMAVAPVAARLVTAVLPVGSAALRSTVAVVAAPAAATTRPTLNVPVVMAA